MSESITLRDAATTRSYGRALGTALRVHAEQRILIGLSGELGAGKTTFVGGVLEAGGIGGSIRSPTYTLIEPYELSSPTRMLYHLDLYRLRNALELEDLGVRELLSGSNVLLVEWIENASPLAEAADLHLRFGYQGSGRILSFEAPSLIGKTLRSMLFEHGVTVHRS